VRQGAVAKLGLQSGMLAVCVDAQCIVTNSLLLELAALNCTHIHVTAWFSFKLVAGLESVHHLFPSLVVFEDSQFAWGAPTSATSCCRHPSPAWCVWTALEVMLSLVVYWAQRLVWSWTVQVVSLCTQAQKYACLLQMSHVVLQGKRNASGTGCSHARRDLSPREVFVPLWGHSEANV
jgi:hypothetical protein